jgi:hypothetical protein
MRLSEGMNTLRFVYCAWIVIDANNRFIPVSEGIAFRESHEAYRFFHLATIDMTPGFDATDVHLAWADDKLCPNRLREYLPNVNLFLDTFHFIVGQKGVCILSIDFGGAWPLVKDHFHQAVYADTEAECMVSSLPSLLALLPHLLIQLSTILSHSIIA